MSTPEKSAPKVRASLRQAVLQARNEGKSCAQIAHELGITKGTLGWILTHLLRCGAIEKQSNASGPSGARLDRWERVRQLTHQGYVAKEIAAELDLCETTIRGDLAALRDLGLIVGSVQAAKIAARRQRVRQLREAGCSRAQIVEQLGVSLITVGRDLAALRGRFRQSKRNAERRITVDRDLASLRVTHPADRLRGKGRKRAEEPSDLPLSILRLRREGERPAEIARALEVNLWRRTEANGPIPCHEASTTTMETPAQIQDYIQNNDRRLRTLYDQPSFPQTESAWPGITASGRSSPKEKR